jgi:hypothetical protein
MRRCGIESGVDVVAGDGDGVLLIVRGGFLVKAVKGSRRPCCVIRFADGEDVDATDREEEGRIFVGSKMLLEEEAADVLLLHLCFGNCRCCPGLIDAAADVVVAVNNKDNARIEINTKFDLLWSFMLYISRTTLT